MIQNQAGADSGEWQVFAGTTQNSSAKEVLGCETSAGSLQENHINDGTSTRSGWTTLGGPIAGG
jgi:hypothetical protein